jgi:hypothetical protein
MHHVDFIILLYYDARSEKHYDLTEFGWGCGLAVSDSLFVTLAICCEQEMDLRV